MGVQVLEGSKYLQVAGYYGAMDTALVESRKRALARAPKVLAVAASVLALSCCFGISGRFIWLAAGAYGLIWFGLFWAEFYKRAASSYTSWMPCLMGASAGVLSTRSKSQGLLSIELAQLTSATFCVTFLLMVMNRRRLLKYLEEMQTKAPPST